MLRRLLASSLVAGFLVVVWAVPASAKMPPFDLEVEAGDDTIVITVSLTEERFDAADLDRLLAVYPANRVDPLGRPIKPSEGQPVALDRVEPGVYRAVVAIASPGRWAVVPFPTILEPIPPDYPATTVFDIPADSVPVGWLAGGAAALAVIVLGLTVFGRRAMLRRHDEQ